MQTISVTQLHKALANSEPYEIIDVRESYEYNVGNLGTKNIPMGEIVARKDELPINVPLVIMCRSGKRAEAVANLLSTEMKMNNIHMLEGGILAWKEMIDSTLELD